MGRSLRLIGGWVGGPQSAPVAFRRTGRGTTEPLMSAPRPLPTVLRSLLAALLLLAVSVSSTSAATDPPVASFTVSIAGGDATFTDTSTNDPTEWRWDFGDGATSKEQNPVHHFAEGTYTVTLVAWNHGGHDTAQRDVTINPPDRIYSKNLYGGLIRYQDPDRTACVATAAMTMLNEIAAAGTGGDGFRWTPSRSYSVQESMFRWTRRHDTLEPGVGSDANGWRNALNQYGWADYADPDTRVYQVFAFRTYNAAVKAAVQAVARFKRPVGILGWAGGHAQVLNGYTVFGQDPATSTSFTVRYVYLTDPLQRDAAPERPDQRLQLPLRGAEVPLPLVSLRRTARTTIPTPPVSRPPGASGTTGS